LLIVTKAADRKHTGKTGSSLAAALLNGALSVSSSSTEHAPFKEACSDVYHQFQESWAAWASKVLPLAATSTGEPPELQFQLSHSSSLSEPASERPLIPRNERGVPLFPAMDLDDLSVSTIITTIICFLEKLWGE
jgi:hypothetical protein